MHSFIRIAASTFGTRPNRILAAGRISCAKLQHAIDSITRAANAAADGARAEKNVPVIYRYKPDRAAAIEINLRVATVARSGLRPSSEAVRGGPGTREPRAGRRRLRKRGRISRWRWVVTCRAVAAATGCP